MYKHIRHDQYIHAGEIKKIISQTKCFSILIATQNNRITIILNGVRTHRCDTKIKESNN